APATGPSAWTAGRFDGPASLASAPAWVEGALRDDTPVNGGSDVLVGGLGDDLLIGAEGRDMIVGGVGHDPGPGGQDVVPAEIAGLEARAGVPGAWASGHDAMAPTSTSAGRDRTGASDLVFLTGGMTATQGDGEDDATILTAGWFAAKRHSGHRAVEDGS